MSTSNTSINSVDAVIYSKILFVRCWSYLLMILGTIGHGFSIYVFTRPSLWSNPCTRYFLATTLCGVFVTFVNTPMRLLFNGYDIDLFGYSIITCKLLTFFLFWARALTSWFIALAAIDRFLCSSRLASLRQWSSIRVASLMIVMMTVMVGLAYIYVPIYYVIKTGHVKCPPSQGPFPSFHGIWNLPIFSSVPPLVMFCFGFLTIRHIRQSLIRVQLQNNQISTQAQQQQPFGQGRRQKRIDGQMSQMMILQCVSFGITLSLISIHWIYMAMRPPLVLDALQLAKDDFFTQVFGTISITGACTSFYFFTISSKLFRVELKQLFKKSTLTLQLTSKRDNGNT